MEIRLFKLNGTHDQWHNNYIQYKHRTYHGHTVLVVVGTVGFIGNIIGIHKKPQNLNTSSIGIIYIEMMRGNLSSSMFNFFFSIIKQTKHDSRGRSSGANTQ